MPTDSLTTPTVPDERPWRTEGLFSPHYLTHRLPNPKSAAWPEAAEADAVFDFARERFAQEGAALKAGNEEDAEGHWIVPLLDRLGFGRNARKAIPGIPTHRLPDFLLYASQPLAQAAFLSKSFYPDCLGLLEAKRWGVNLSREGTKSKERSPQTQLRDYLSETPALFWGILTHGGQLTCPIFRRRRDAELTRKIYENVPILVHETPAGPVNPWGIQFSAMFHKANDLHLFETAKDLEAEGHWLGEGSVYTKGKVRYLPLYEGKVFQQYDHRAANIEVAEKNVHRPGQQGAISGTEWNDLGFSALSRFWVPENEVISSLRYGDKTRWQLGFKNVCSPTNIRSMIMTALPVCGAGHSIQFVTPDIAFGGKLWACFLANANAFTFDYVARQKIGGVNFSY